MTLEEAQFVILERRFNDLMGRFEKVNNGLSELKFKLMDLEIHVTKERMQVDTSIRELKLALLSRHSQSN